MKRFWWILVCFLFIPHSAFGQLRPTEQRVLYLRSNAATDCTGVLFQNEACNISLKLHGQVAPGVSPRADEVLIRSITILSIQNLAWDINIYTKDTRNTEDIDADTFLDYVSFTAANGLQTTPNVGGTAYRYQSRDLNIRYRDMDAVEETSTTSEIHLQIVNRSTSFKEADASGKIVVIVTAEPIQ